MTGQTIALTNSYRRKLAHQLIDQAPYGYTVHIKAPTRSNAQNDKMWAILGDISRAKPDGRSMTPDLWKAVFLQALGHEQQFLMGLDGNPFPMGFRSSKLSKEQMSDLIEFIHSYAATHGVKLED